MSITVSSSELTRLGQINELLLTPLDHDSVDHWRAAVNRELRELLHADSAGFLLPVEDGLALYSEEHDPAELARYPDYPPPPLVDGRSIWEVIVHEQVTTLATGYGRHYDRYLNSAYYNEYSGANGAHDTLAAAIPLGGTDGRSIACLHFWHARPDGRLFGEREVALLRLVFPAFRAGVEAHLRWDAQRDDLLGALDRLARPAAIADRSGRLLHLSGALEELLAGDAEAGVLRERIHRVVDQVRRGIATGGAARGTAPASQEVSTATARYRVCGFRYGRRQLGDPGYIVVTLERCTPAAPPPEALQETFSLTPAEARVAGLLARGRSNAEIAKELIISPHTARRHTERVLMKMNLRSRSEVPARIFL